MQALVVNHRTDHGTQRVDFFLRVLTVGIKRQPAAGSLDPEYLVVVNVPDMNNRMVRVRALCRTGITDNLPLNIGITVVQLDEKLTLAGFQ